MLKSLTLHDGSKKAVHLGGWSKDKEDKRDWILKSPHSALPNMAITLPAAVDNSSNCSPIEDQGQLGSCTAHMFAGITEYNDIKWGQKPGFTRVSRLFEYYATRKIEGTTKQDSGATIRDAIKAGGIFGLIDEAEWPYDISKFTKRPPRALWTAARKNVIKSYHRITNGDLTTMKQVLAGGYLVGFGFLVYSNMMTQETAQTGILHVPGPNDQYEGGHAVVLVGYDDAKGAFKVRNSWGTDWGQEGYFWMDYDYVANVKLCNDFWVVDSVSEM